MKIDIVDAGEVLLLLLLILRCSILSAAEYRSFSKKDVTFYDKDDDYLSSFTEKSTPNNRIAGGYTAQEGEFPSFVSLLGKRRDLFSLCSGVAISDQLILTAAHCFPNSESWDRIIAAPGIRRPQPSDIRRKQIKIYDVDLACRSRLYDENAEFPEYDYQVLRLSKPIPGIRYSKLAANDVPLGSRGIVAGIGLIDNSGYQPIYADSLQALPVQRVQCGWNGKPSHICFQSYDPGYIGDTCSGDSGGPIYMKGVGGGLVIVGITSFGETTCAKGHRGVSFNANVFTGLEEIQYLAKQCAPT